MQDAQTFVHQLKDPQTLGMPIRATSIYRAHHAHRGLCFKNTKAIGDLRTLQMGARLGLCGSGLGFTVYLWISRS